VTGATLSAGATRWIVHWSIIDAPRLLCLAAAGGGAGPFRPWADWLAPDVAVSAFRFPGRESRLAEPSIDRLDDLVDAAADAVEECFGGTGDIALAGICWGALIAFEVAWKLERRGSTLVRMLIVAGEPAPRLLASTAVEDPAPDVWERAGAIGGTDPKVRDHPQMRQLLEPALRADFALEDRYCYAHSDPLSCPIVAIAAVEDQLVPPDAVEAWRTETKAGFDFRLVEGMHFLPSGRGWRRLALAVAASVAAARREAGAV
jgi:medium-chain acyl-[acyl-carrier-protein] hydrolase